MSGTILNTVYTLTHFLSPAALIPGMGGPGQTRISQIERYSPGIGCCGGLNKNDSDGLMCLKALSPGNGIL